MNVRPLILRDALEAGPARFAPGAPVLRRSRLLGMDHEFDIPDPVRRKAAELGATGEAWLAGLAPRLADLSALWGLAVGGVLGGATEALVVEVTTREGRAAVLKLLPPGRQVTAEVATLVSAAGRGYAKVYAVDVGRGAVLLERLGPTLADLGLPVSSQIDAICEALIDAWDVSLDSDLLVSGAVKAAALRDSISETWRELGFPRPDPVLDAALRYASERCRRFDPGAAVVAHGDAHPWNALVVPGTQPERFKLIDPDGVFVERAYDLGVLMREWSSEYAAGDPLEAGIARCCSLAERAGVAPRAVWEWGFLECVSTGLLCTKLGLDEGDELLAMARAWAERSSESVPE